MGPNEVPGESIQQGRTKSFHSEVVGIARIQCPPPCIATVSQPHMLKKHPPAAGRMLLLLLYTTHVTHSDMWAMQYANSLCLMIFPLFFLLRTRLYDLVKKEGCATASKGEKKNLTIHRELCFIFSRFSRSRAPSFVFRLACRRRSTWFGRTRHTRD